MNAQQDTWLLPTRQYERPGLDPLSEATLHGRREGTFVVLAAIVFTATIAAALVGGTLDDVASALGIELPLATVPMGAILAATALTGALIVSELYGRRRALALVTTATLSSFAILALCDFEVETIAMATALAGGLLVAVIAASAMHRALDGRQTWLRTVFALVLAQGVAAAIYGGVLMLDGADGDATLLTATAMWAFGAACAVIGGVVVVGTKRGLGSYLRVIGLLSPGRALPPAYIVDDLPTEPHKMPVIPRRSARLFTTAEIEFFDEGEHLADDEIEYVL